MDELILHFIEIFHLEGPLRRILNWIEPRLQIAQQARYDAESHMWTVWSIWTRPLDLSEPWTENPFGPECFDWLIHNLPEYERELYLLGYPVAECVTVGRYLRREGLTLDFARPYLRLPWPPLSPDAITRFNLWVVKQCHTR